MRSAPDPETGARALLDSVQRELDVSGGLVLLAEKERVRVLAAVGIPTEWTATWTALPAAAFARRIVPGVVRESLAATNPKIDVPLKRRGVRGVLTLPLRGPGRDAGAIILTSTKRDPFPETDRPGLEGIAASFARWLMENGDEAVEAEIDDLFGPPADDGPDSLATSIGAMAIATLDFDGRFLETGPAFGRLLGVPSDSLPGRSLASVLAAQEEARLRAAIETARAQSVAVLPSARPHGADDPDRPVAFDLILSRRDDSVIVALGLPVVDVVAAAGMDGPPAADESGSRDGGLRRPSSGVVILDRRSIETSTQWRRWSGELLAVLGGSTLVLDPGGRIVELGAEWLGDDEGSSVGRLGRHFGELFETERVDVLDALRTVARDGMWSGHFKAHGVPVPVYLRAVRNDRGELEAIVGAKLPERMPEVRDLFQKVPVGLVVVDRELRVLEVNPELAAVLRGCDLPPDLRGLDVRTLAPFGTREAREALDSLPVKRGLDLPDVRLRRRAPAPPLVVQLHAQELHDAAEQPVGFLLAILGRAGKTQLENRLIEAQKMESIGNFAAWLAHDFGNFVAVILAKAKALRPKIAEIPAAARQLVDVEVAAKRAQHLAEELIRFARGGRSRVEPLQPNRLIKEVVALIEASVGPDIDVRLELAEGLPSIEGDEVELQQMILNLCLNARDAMEHGGTLTLETRALGRHELGLLGTGDPVESGVCLLVGDTGAGIPEEIRKHIFEPFFSTKDDQSNGLGLAMVYAIVRRHGGTIDVTSEPGRGSTFEVLLPGRGAPEPEAPAKARVLVADDEPAFREMIRLILEDSGCEVQLVRDGMEALEAIHSDHKGLGLVILDLRMPGVDGLDVLEELRSVAPDLPVLVTSGWAEPEDLETARRRGAGRILRKPYRAAQLRQAVAEMLRTDETPRPAAVDVDSGGPVG